MRGLLALLLLTNAASAEPLDTAEKFKAYVEGRTMIFHQGDGRVVASESYLPDQTVRWSRGPGDCLDGRWFAQDGLICFVYENSPSPQCWSVEVTAGGLRATSSSGSGLSFFEAGDGPPQQCPGPKVGV